jgi:hypothetical protein
MKTKRIIEGLNNNQKFRAIINGVYIGDCMVKDLTGNRFLHQGQRIAVWYALEQIGKAHSLGSQMVNSFATHRDGIDIQVDLL